MNIWHLFRKHSPWMRMSVIAAKFASYLSYTGRPQEALASVKRAMRLNPHHPDWYWQELGLALYVGGQYAKAIHAFNHIAKLVDFDYAYLAACCVSLNEINQAKSHVADLRSMSSRASIKFYEKTQPYKNTADLEKFIDALRNERPYQVDGNAACKSIALIEAIYRSAASGAVVEM